MQVVEIFKSIDGEGKRAGLPATFIRLAGCNCRCSYCDTEYSFNMNDAKTMTVEEIVDAVEEIGIPAITITGGEPLIHEDIDVLLKELSNTGKFDINVETNGTVDPSKYYALPNVWFTIDYKCYSSGERDRMNLDIYRNMRKQDVIKFVVGGQEDLQDCLRVLELNPVSEVFIGPVFGYSPTNIVKFLLENKLYNCKCQLQMHKYIWPPEMRGV